jgi:hypothetical protein
VFSFPIGNRGGGGGGNGGERLNCRVSFIVDFNAHFKQHIVIAYRWWPLRRWWRIRCVFVVLIYITLFSQVAHFAIFGTAHLRRRWLRWWRLWWWISRWLWWRWELWKWCLVMHVTMNASFGPDVMMCADSHRPELIELLIVATNYRVNQFNER